MGFSTALSGLKAASTSLQVLGNNIANSQTTGFKQSRAEFADVYSNSLGGVSKTQPGAGVKTTEVAQQFNQGNIEPTQNSLDLAISGNGFFVLSDAADGIPSAYTRNGAFQLDPKGNVITDQGQYLLAYAPNGKTVEAGFSTGVFKPITIDTAQGLPTATANINIKSNLDSTSIAKDPALFVDPTASPPTYNNTTSVTIYDSQGSPHILTTYYVKDTAAANTWQAYEFLDGFGINAADPADPASISTATALNTPGTPITLVFDTSGALSTVNGLASTKVHFGNLDFSTTINPALKVDLMNFEVNFAGGTQYATPFSVNGLNQDGLPAGNLSGIEVDGEGVVYARYTNGGSKPLGQVALARFQSNQALAKLGDTNWGQSSGAGAPIYGAAGDNNFGDIQSAALEGSNVDLAEQLVKLIISQQAYQANSQTITTEKTLMQTILNA